MKVLFDKDERYTKNGLEFDRQIGDAIRPIFQWWVSQGYSIRQLGYISRMTMMDEELMTILSKEPK